ncbi:MAG TPA: 2TM domain-containing protein [Chitinophagaceae bacterium]|nr:2TM domain-containing protein [Chitinophagaceae bacterium]
METNRDEELWRLAKKRAGFQRSLAFYFVINAFLWIVWWFTTDNRGFSGHTPWPIWVMLGWVIALVFQYLSAYGGSKQSLTDKEYERLKMQKIIIHN